MSVILKNQYYNRHQKLKFIRYPGGKNRLLQFIIPLLPSRNNIKGQYVEPFVGSGAVFFCLNPKKAILSDTNKELIRLYRGIKNYHQSIWKKFESFPASKRFYYHIRSSDIKSESISYRAARILYLNRTCFKGMWRYNQKGEFNVGYGGQDRRWVIDQESLNQVSKRLKTATLKNKDFEEVIDNCKKNDFVFLDPPYSPGERKTLDYHYEYNQFGYEDHERLAQTLRRASDRGVKWAMTTSSHKEIKKLFSSLNFYPITMGVGDRPGILSYNSGELLFNNYSKI